jgi:hypothetical protein
MGSVWRRKVQSLIAPYNDPQNTDGPLTEFFQDRKARQTETYEKKEGRKKERKKGKKERRKENKDRGLN